MTNRFCVVGSPIDHSLSPLLHKACYDFLDLDFSYEKSEVRLGELSGFTKQHPFSGISVTMPLKREAYELAIQRDEVSEKTGLANTLVLGEKGYLASNTDVFGVSQALAGVGGIKRVGLLGTGATSKSVLVALEERFPSIRVEIWGRDLNRIRETVDFAGSLDLLPEPQIDLEKAISGSDLIISALPGRVVDDFWASRGNYHPGWLFETAYSNNPSAAALKFQESRVISGVEMLMWQAIAQIKLFVAHFAAGIEIDANNMYQVMKRALQQS